MTTPHCTKTRRGLGQNGLSTNGCTGNEYVKIGESEQEEHEKEKT